jgi:hypothetical protein
MVRIDMNSSRKTALKGALAAADSSGDHGFCRPVHNLNCTLGAVSLGIGATTPSAIHPAIEIGTVDMVLPTMKGRA